MCKTSSQTKKSFRSAPDMIVAVSRNLRLKTLKEAKVMMQVALARTHDKRRSLKANPRPKTSNSQETDFDDQHHVFFSSIGFCPGAKLASE